MTNFNCKTKNRQAKIEDWGREIQIWGRGLGPGARAGGRETQILANKTV